MARRKLDLPDYSALKVLRLTLGEPGWAREGDEGVIQVQPWLSEDDADWMAKHLELAGYRYSETWYSGWII